jgi:cytidylate kinase
MESPARILVAISRQMGAGGAYVGQALARRSALRYIDREILQEAAKVLGRDDRELESLEERVTSVWTRMAGILSWGAPEAPYVPPPIPTVLEDDLFATEAEIIRGLAAREDGVFVGRAAGWVLRGRPGLLSVFLHAPEAARIRRVVQAYSLAEDEARHLIRHSDQQRSRFLTSVRGCDWLDASTYDLCFDTSRVEVDEVVDLLAGLVSRRQTA